MKKPTLIILLAVLLVGCKPSYEKAIDKYLNDNLKDPSSYECIELGEPGIITPMSIAFVECVRRANAGEFPHDSVNSKLDQIKIMFEQNGTNPYDTLGWEVNHKYRAKNSYGALEIEEVSYIFDKELKEIVDTRRE